MILTDNNGAKRGRQEERRKEHGRLHVVAPVEFRLRYGLKLNKVVNKVIIMEDTTEERIKELVYLENSNVADRMEVITMLIGMVEKPSPTWCRHSYATNLRDAGVPAEYISTMMGHTMTSGSATTLNYLSRYNMTTMMAYNSKLLRDGEEDKKREKIMEELNGLDTETLSAILKLTKLR